MALNIDDLGTVLEELFSIRAKAYNIGLVLKVPVVTLDTIFSQFVDLTDKLRETLKAWLKMASQQKWQTIVEALRAVGDPNLASDIETKYCACQGTIVPLGQASEQAMQIQEVERQMQQLGKPKQRQFFSPEKSQKTVDQLEQKIQEGQQPILEATGKEPIWLPCPDAQALSRRYAHHGQPKDQMYRGSVAINGNIVYFNGYASYRVYQYSDFSQQWSLLPQLLYPNCTLVMVNEKLTCVGGSIPERDHKVVNSLLSIDTAGVFSAPYGAWFQHFPPMCIRRSLPAVACDGRSLIAAGGCGDSITDTLNVVEIMDVNTQQWSTASSMPRPFVCATAAICGERLYVLGGFPKMPDCTVNSVFVCFIPELLKSCQTQPLASLDSRPSPLTPLVPDWDMTTYETWTWAKCNSTTTPPARSQRTEVWKCVADAPCQASSCTILRGRLVVLGGVFRGKKSTTISIYNETTDSWQALKPGLKTPRVYPLVASLHDKIMVVGGHLQAPTVEWHTVKL